jgi:hypothetical protein
MGKLDTDGAVLVKVIKLDDIIRNGLPMPEVIKMDIEGSEADALRGAECLLRKASPIIFLSTHGDAVKEECRMFLASLGFDMDLLVGDETGTEFIVKRRESEVVPVR